MLKAYAVALMLTTTPATANLDGAKQTEQQKPIISQTTQTNKGWGLGIGL
ncbi:hypothetical protein [Aliiglaciecola litoralis]|uniref:Uncharacterized protein n=1 Tax=Aliiglaciecola litoralis TaxID=582857 RepID=A0ABN1LDF7_9ALTE